MSAMAQDLPEALPHSPFHLTSRPWKPLNISRDSYLDAIEGVCRFTVRQQDARGAVIDPFLHREHQYSTPYFAFAVGALIHADRAKDIWDNGVRAMDHATACFAKGNAGIPDGHGEFFDASLPGALELYKGHVPAEKLNLWRERLRTPRTQVVGNNTNNWRAYAMKGEWLRAKLGLADRDNAVAFIEDAWLHATQRSRIALDKWNLYEDHSSDPESHAVEGVGRGNLLALVHEGYDGQSADEMRRAVERGTAVSLLLQDPSGQCPPDGRTDDHVFNDVLYQLCFEVLSERTKQDALLSAQYRHAAMLSFKSIERWRRSDGPWAGSYFVTKNRFDPALRVGYQAASNYGNYNGAVMIHLAEAYLARKSEIPEQPAPAELGGYAFATDAKFASAVANAGGMLMFVALRGDTKKVFARYWTALGVARFARVHWDSRLGPSDGERDAATGRGVTFAPTWLENGQWVRLADVPERYHGEFSVQFVHPLLVRCAIAYAPLKGVSSGPSFRHEFVLTPDGVLATLRSADAVGHASGLSSVKEFGVTWPLLEDDGAPLRPRVTAHLAATSYGENVGRSSGSPGDPEVRPTTADEQCFLLLGEGTVARDDERVRSTYGWLNPVRATAGQVANHTFVYPRNASDPSAEAVRASFRLTADGYESDIGSAHGSLYVGRTSAGGEGQNIDCDGDGKPEAAFDAACRFVLQLRLGKIVTVEADRKTGVRIGGKQLQLEAYQPVTVTGE